MPLPTPFHPRTAERCTSLLYKEWAGCYAVRRYDVYHEREYYALRHAATVMDAPEACPTRYDWHCPTVTAWFCYGPKIFGQLEEPGVITMAPEMCATSAWGCWG